MKLFYFLFVALLAFNLLSGVRLPIAYGFMPGDKDLITFSSASNSSSDEESESEEENEEVFEDAETVVIERIGELNMADLGLLLADPEEPQEGKQEESENEEVPVT